MRIAKLRKRRGGAVAVESAIVLPIALVVLFAIVSGALAVFTYQQVASLARDEEDAAAEVARLFRELRAGAAADGTVSYYPALLWCSLRLPELADEERDELRERLRQWQDARAAERHYRQALSHTEKGEYDKAVEALTETVRLAPDNADAFRERAALLLRRSKPQEAALDFTQALNLEPGMAAAHLGRGQAHLPSRVHRIRSAFPRF